MVLVILLSLVLEDKTDNSTNRLFALNIIYVFCFASVSFSSLLLNYNHSHYYSSNLKLL